ncbi:MAG TPA: SCO family protein, partial [Vicinamibacterales bacterium]
PLMDRHFVTIQKTLKADSGLAKVHLVTVSFDPLTDTPAVLKAHAKTLDADLSRWTFLTGDRDEIDRFGARFGVSVSRALNDARDITHNLRTAIIGADGKLDKVYTGNEWTPSQILEELRKS